MSIITNTAKNTLVTYLFSNYTYTIHLYKNDRTPTANDTESDYEEADFEGYAAKPLAASSWTVSGNTATSTQQLFTATNGSYPNTIYGYYITNNSDDAVYFAEKFSSSISISTTNDGLYLTVEVSIS